MSAYELLMEKAESKSQQRLMGMALAYKRGELDDASEAVKDIANEMTIKQLEDFAKTKHADLPDRVAEAIEEELSIAQRRRSGQRMRKNKSRLKMGARKFSHRRADKKRLMKRASRSARSQFSKKLTGGVSKDKLNISRKSAIEKRLKKYSSPIKKLTARKFIQARKRDASK